MSSFTSVFLCGPSLSIAPVTGAQHIHSVYRKHLLKHVHSSRLSFVTISPPSRSFYCRFSTGLIAIFRVLIAPANSLFHWHTSSNLDLFILVFSFLLRAFLLRRSTLLITFHNPLLYNDLSYLSSALISFSSFLSRSCCLHALNHQQLVSFSTFINSCRLILSPNPLVPLGQDKVYSYDDLFKSLIFEISSGKNLRRKYLLSLSAHVYWKRIDLLVTALSRR